MRSRSCRRAGFSLVELLMVLVIAGVIGAALVPVLRRTFEAYDTTTTEIIVMDKLRYTTERLAREIREITFPAGAASITAATARSMTFTRNFLDSSGTSSSAAVTVGSTATTVTLAYSTLLAGAAQTLTDELNGINALALVYYDASGNAIATGSLATLINSVRSIQVSITLTHNGRTFTQRTLVTLKNAG